MLRRIHEVVYLLGLLLGLPIAGLDTIDIVHQNAKRFCNRPQYLIFVKWWKALETNFPARRRIFARCAAVTTCSC